MCRVFKEVEDMPGTYFNSIRQVLLILICFGSFLFKKIEICLVLLSVGYPDPDPGIFLGLPDSVVEPEPEP
jgi:hypothetical protein